MLKKKLKTNKNLRRQREIYMHVLHTRLQRKTSNLQLLNSLYLCTIHFYLYREMRKKMFDFILLFIEHWPLHIILWNVNKHTPFGQTHKNSTIEL